MVFLVRIGSSMLSFTLSECWTNAETRVLDER